MAKTLEDFVITKNLPRERSFMFGKSVEKKENRGIVMCFLVAVYTITSIVFLLQVNQYTQDIYDFPYLVSSQARIMKSRLYDFRSLTPVLFSSKDLNSAQLENSGNASKTKHYDYWRSLSRQPGRTAGIKRCIEKYRSAPTRARGTHSRRSHRRKRH